MPDLSAPPARPRGSGFRAPPLPSSGATEQRLEVAVAAIGYLVPCEDFAARVHSVFAQACNLQCNDMLLTLCAPRAGDGPATLRLARGAAEDLRVLFDVGERVDCRRGLARTRRIELRLAGARVWRPAAPRALLPGARIDAHLRLACRRVAERRRTHTSVVDGDGAPVVAALAEACRVLDRDAAVQCVHRLIGWGEGLTPAGDDFLVGLCAGLAALGHRHARHRAFLDGLAVAVSARVSRTTPIAAHYLRLAAQGHHTETLLLLRDALLGEPRPERVGAALDRALDIGATSGADTVTGLLSGLAAWLPLLREPA